MAKRIKSDILDIKSQSEFFALIDETAKLQLQKEALALDLDSKLAAIREEFEPQFKELDEVIGVNVVRCERYATIHRETLFGKLQSTASALTTFGFRVGNPILVLLSRKWNWDSVLEAIKAKDWTHLIRMKEEPNKDAIKSQLTDEERAAIGTRVEQKEAFFIEPKREIAPEERIQTEPTKAAA